MAKNALGRGLSSLMGGVTEKSAENAAVERVHVDDTERRIAEEGQDVSRETSKVSSENVSRETSAGNSKNVSRETFEEVVLEEIESKEKKEVALNALKAPSSIGELSVDDIYPNPNQPRTNFNQDELKELSKSIKLNGLLQPILVRQLSDGTYQIIAGERRWQACKMAGIDKVPVRIKEADDDKALELALIENVQRSDLNPIEEAYGYKRLMDRKKMSQADIAQAMSKGRSTIANSLRLLDLPEEAQQLLFENKITAGHARAILAVPTKDGRQSLTDKLVDKKLSVRETETIARLLTNKPDGKIPRAEIPQTYKTVAKALRNALNTNVKIKNSGGRNRIEIEFQDEEDLRRLFDELIAYVS